MNKRKKSFLKKALRADSLLILLVLVCIGLLSGQYGTESATVEAGIEQSEPAGQPHDFGAMVAGPPVWADDVLNAKLADMPRAAKCSTLRFMMLNAHNYFVREDAQRTRFKITHKSEESRDAVAEVIASVQPEVVGLIEMGGPHALADLQLRLSKRNCEYPHAYILCRGGEDRALAILSRFPIVQNHSRANCSLLGNKRQKMLRGILDVTIQVGENRFFRIVGAHLKSRVSDDPAAATARRKLEARTLAMYLQQEMRKMPQMPFVVYGDWNDGPADASVKTLTQGISADAALSRVQALDSRGQSWTIHYRAAEEYCLFDQIFVNAVMRSRRGRSCAAGVADVPAAQTASDHRGVWCELR